MSDGDSRQAGRPGLPAHAMKVSRAGRHVWWIAGAADARRLALDSDRRKSEFLAHTSHRIRTSLNAIITESHGCAPALERAPGAGTTARVRLPARRLHDSVSG